MTKPKSLAALWVGKLLPLKNNIYRSVNFIKKHPCLLARVLLFLYWWKTDEHLIRHRLRDATFPSRGRLFICKLRKLLRKQGGLRRPWGCSTRRNDGPYRGGQSDRIFQKKKLPSETEKSFWFYKFGEKRGEESLRHFRSLTENATSL